MKGLFENRWARFTAILWLCAGLSFGVSSAQANIRLLEEVKIADKGLYFDGIKVSKNSLKAGKAGLGSKYNYMYRSAITAQGDSIKVHKHFVFMAWYKGGKIKRQLMLSRYNTQTGDVKTIEFPHRHTGLKGHAFVGNSQGTVAIGVSPVNGSIHLVYDLHGYSPTIPPDGSFKEDFFRYSYSVPYAAEVEDQAFNLGLFITDNSKISEGPDDYKHLSMTGNLSDKGSFSALSSPAFFTRDDGTLIFTARRGGGVNASVVFNHYDAEAKHWTDMVVFNVLDAKRKGLGFNWGPYGGLKYLDGKLRVGFQRRASITWDKYRYQNGLYYGYSDNENGEADWRTYDGKRMTFPLVNADEIKVYEPGDLITHTDKNSLHMASNFDWTVTDRGDVHMVSRIRSSSRKRADFQDIYLHSYKPAGSDTFIHAEGPKNVRSLHTAGGDVFIIGVDGEGYPYIKRAKGGTKDFERVYQVTSGTQFTHGLPYIKDGKLYFFLVDSQPGAARPLYLQIIDLDLESSTRAALPYPRIQFEHPLLSVTKGYEELVMNIDVVSPEEGREITEVALYIDDKLIRTQTSAPYSWGNTDKPSELLGVAVGQHELRVVAKDDTGLEGYATMILHVKPQGKPEVQFKKSEIDVTEGYNQLVMSVDVTPADEETPIEKVVLHVNGQVLRADRTPPYVWGHKAKSDELLGLPTGENELTVIARDVAGQEVTDTMIINVLPRAKSPILTKKERLVFEKLR